MPCLLLVQRAPGNFNVVIFKRLLLSKVNKPPLSLSRLILFTKGKEAKIDVVVGAVTNDICVYRDIQLKPGVFPVSKLYC
ncbi:hypothetical protein RYX36_033776 [Vicia faba]